MDSRLIAIFLLEYFFPYESASCKGADCRWVLWYANCFLYLRVSNPEVAVRLGAVEHVQGCLLSGRRLVLVGITWPASGRQEYPRLH